MQMPDLVAAHKHSFENRGELLTSESCGCFYCLAIFPPTEIVNWIDERSGQSTASCPRCRIDSVIGSKSEYPITVEFLDAMRTHWFFSEEAGAIL
jgi:hypothetical protein